MHSIGKLVSSIASSLVASVSKFAIARGADAGTWVSSFVGRRFECDTLNRGLLLSF